MSTHDDPRLASLNFVIPPAVAEHAVNDARFGFMTLYVIAKDGQPLASIGELDTQFIMYTYPEADAVYAFGVGNKSKHSIRPIDLGPATVRQVETIMLIRDLKNKIESEQHELTLAEYITQGLEHEGLCTGQRAQDLGQQFATLITQRFMSKEDK